MPSRVLRALMLSGLFAACEGQFSAPLGGIVEFE
jgi:hypothetical protein